MADLSMQVRTSDAVNTTLSSIEQSVDATFEDIARYNIFQVAGDDRLGRKVIVFSASKLPPYGDISHDRLLQYMRRRLDMYVESDYIIVYFHHGLTSDNRPSFKWLRMVYSDLERKYKKNLKNFYIVHPTYFIKIVFNLFLPIVSFKFGRKIVYCNYLRDLERDMALDQLAIPAPVRDYDRDLVAKSRSRQAGVPLPVVERAATSQFGVSLQFMKNHNNGDVISPVLRQCSDYIRAHGMQVEGIFRRSPNKALQEKLQDQYNRGDKVNLGDNADDVHLAASLLKSQLRQLPQPLLTNELYDEFILAQSLKGDSQVKELQILVARLPPDNYAVLDYLISFLTEVTAQCDANKMTAQNLGVVFGPSLLWASEAQTSFASIAAVNRCVEQLIRHYAAIFKQ